MLRCEHSQAAQSGWPILRASAKVGVFANARTDLLRHYPSRKGNGYENKSKKCGVSFACDFNVVFSPRSPHIPPQFHHQKTTLSHLFFAKTPAKTHLYHTRKKPCIKWYFCIQPIMTSSPPPPEKRPAFSSPLMFFIIAGIIIASITLFMIFRPNPSGTTPQSNTPATQQ